MSLKQRLMSNSFTGESNLKGQEEGQGGWSREGRGEPNKDVKWSLCSGRLLSHVGQKSGKLIPPRKALSTIFPFLLSNCTLCAIQSPTLQVAHMQWPGEFQGTAGKPQCESWETCRAAVRQFEVEIAWSYSGPAKSWPPRCQLEQDLGEAESICHCAEEGLTHWVTSDYLTGTSSHVAFSGKPSLILNQT